MEKDDKTVKVDRLESNDVENSQNPTSVLIENVSDSLSERDSTSYARKRYGKQASLDSSVDTVIGNTNQAAEEKRRSWRRILLLIVAITVHNVPGRMSFCHRRKSKVILSSTKIQGHFVIDENPMSFCHRRKSKVILSSTKIQVNIRVL